jgi:CRISPR-associated protein Cas1
MKAYYYLFNAGYLKRKENSLYLKRDEEAEEKILGAGYELPLDTEVVNKRLPQDTHIPIETVDSLFCFGETVFSTRIFRFLGKKNIPVHFFDYYGNYTGMFYPREEIINGLVVMQQARHYLDPDKRLELARQFVMGALANADKTLGYYERQGKNMTAQRIAVQEMLEDAGGATAIPRLMGCEGYGRKRYFEGWRTALDPIPFEGRVSHPPGCPVNAAISFANALLYAVLVSELYHLGLNPMISYLHEPSERRLSLAMDLADVFKPILSDRVVLAMFNTGAIQQEKHFEKKKGGVYLNDEGRKILTKRFDERLKKTIEHRQLKRNVSYRQLIQIECNHLAGHLKGNQQYESFRSWW